MMTTKKSKFEKTKKLFAVSAFAGLSILFVQKIYASEIETISPSIPTEITINNFNNLDTIPQRIEAKTNVKLKNSKKVKTPPTPKEFKENELPIPPPPPPARNLTNAEFPEGLNNLRKGIAEAFDSSSFDGKKGTIKTNLFITINKYGETVDVKPDGDNQKFNEEAIKAFKTATQGKTWKPATEDGKEATTVFQLPVTMQFL